MLAELFGRSNGYCCGKGGSMHLADFSIGMLGANGIVGAGMPDAATFRALHVPPKRVCAPDVPIPYSPVMEQFCLPDKARIIAAVREVLAA